MTLYLSQVCVRFPLLKFHILTTLHFIILTTLPYIIDFQTVADTIITSYLPSVILTTFAINEDEIKNKVNKKNPS